MSTLDPEELQPVEVGLKQIERVLHTLQGLEDIIMIVSSTLEGQDLLVPPYLDILKEVQKGLAKGIHAQNQPTREGKSLKSRSLHLTFTLLGR